jgi:hypothetical protein
MSPFYTLISFVRSLLTLEELGINTYATLSIAALTPAVRRYTLFYGFYFFHFTFALILFYKLLSREKFQYAEKYSFIFFFFLCMLAGALSMYVVAPYVHPYRFLIFGWLFGSAPLTAIILKDRRKWLRKIGVFLLIAFMIFNIYMFEPTAWDAKAEGLPGAASEEDYALANTIDFSNGKIFGPTNSLMVIYYLYNNLGTIFSYPYTSQFNLSNFDYIIIYKTELELEKKYNPNPRTETIATLRALMNGSSTKYDKIYESNNILVFKPRK